MRRFTHHRFARNMRRRAGNSKVHWQFKKITGLFYQFLLPLILFQLIRTLLIPTTFDVILLTMLVCLYVFYWLP